MFERNGIKLPMILVEKRKYLHFPFTNASNEKNKEIEKITL